jgi:hypothetical protein
MSDGAARRCDVVAPERRVSSIWLFAGSAACYCIEVPSEGQDCDGLYTHPDVSTKST